ncbi:hypothetical protein QR680_004931 [Steinernema hermaphroditum]|uniref:MalT-like TPR region domain-containing protein n=1 Tax=Steinernema hermaphroditum TaxID=289476 RepID=A0AA39HQA3_9BILA|nr:hypothetical protein QR680_004931 [Steinernema hermaphroditum]
MAEGEKPECLALAQEGERLIRDNNVHLGIQHLEKAIELGNAYFSIRNYTKALHFHRHDLVIAEMMKDPSGKAKAYGNLGNTNKALANYKDALYYCELHLKIAQRMNDPICVARALYNLATVYHSKGSQNNQPQLSSHDQSSASVSREDLRRAVELYKQNLDVVEQLHDLFSQGRTFGNLGNVYYLLGDFETAVFYHQKRLDIARQFCDRAAMRRAWSNLGNAHVRMSKWDEAIHNYKLALSLARELKDCAGEARACASLAACFESKNDRPKALYFLALNRKLAKELRDPAMEMSANDQIKQLLQGEAGASLIVDGRLKTDDSADPSRADMSKLLSASLQSLITKISMANGVSTTPLDTSLHSSTSAECGVSQTSATEFLNASNMSKQSTSTLSAKDKKPPVCSTNSQVAPKEDIFTMIQRMQSKRIDDQRCDVWVLNNVMNKTGGGPSDNTSVFADVSAQTLPTPASKKKEKKLRNFLRRPSKKGSTTSESNL